MYDLRYLAPVRIEMEEIIRYHVDELKNPKAARDLQKEMDKKIQRLRDFPFSCQVYQSTKPLTQQYRLLLVKNYYIIYTVLEQTVEIHHVTYARRNLHRFFV